MHLRRVHTRRLSCAIAYGRHKLACLPVTERPQEPVIARAESLRSHSCRLFLCAQLGFDTKLDPALGMAAVAGATALFLHRHLPTAQPPRLAAVLEDHTRASGAGDQGGASDSSKTEAAGGSADDGDWNFVSADDAAPAVNGAGAHQMCASEGRSPVGAPVRQDSLPSEATRTAANGGTGGSANLDPAAGREAAAAAPPQASRSGGAGGDQSQNAKGGAFLPAAAELGSLGPGAAANGRTRMAATAEEAMQVDRAAEASKVAMGHGTQAAMQALLGDLAEINELHA